MNILIPVLTICVSNDFHVLTTMNISRWLSGNGGMSNDARRSGTHILGLVSSLLLDALETDSIFNTDNCCADLAIPDGPAWGCSRLAACTAFLFPLPALKHDVSKALIAGKRTVIGVRFNDII